MERVPLCTVGGCPAPRDPDWHVPVCGHGVAGEHQHFPKRSQGGKEIVAFLCHDCHMETDNGLWHDGVYDLWGERHYYIVDIHGESLVDIKIGASTETSQGSADEAPNRIGPGESTRSVTVTKEAVSDAEWAAKSSPGPLSILEPLPPDLTFEEWVAAGEALGKIRAVAQWRIGEWLLYGERRYGEMYTQAMDVTGLSYSRLATITSTVGAFEELPMAALLPFSVAEIIAPIARESHAEAAEMLSEASSEGWSVEDARAAVRAHRGELIIEPEQCVCECGHRHKRKG